MLYMLYFSSDGLTYSMANAASRQQCVDANFVNFCNEVGYYFSSRPNTIESFIVLFHANVCSEPLRPRELHSLDIFARIFALVTEILYSFVHSFLITIQRLLQGGSSYPICGSGKIQPVL